ncbi:hypothetical protein B0H19DRAFT_1113499 [Mycena capillaripes]|nr:hypothetical protein B0H19DRAFT_1113499 [Mycena capillaripes]
MFTSIVFTAVLASSAILRSQAIVDPNEPGPGESFNQGTTCHIGWAGDDSGTDAWKNMAIELMSGPNEAMVHLTTVAQNQDGSTTGVFDYPCPEVTPNSQIYFYQFSAAKQNFTWTGRFTIAGTDGSSTPPTESGPALDAQKNPVLWGKGALVDPSTAVAAPTFDSTTTDNSTSASGSGPSSSSNSAPVTPSSTSNTPNTPSKSSSGSSSPAKSSSPSVSGSAPQNSESSAAIAVGPMALDTRVWPFVTALTASALAFTILL